MPYIRRYRYGTKAAGKQKYSVFRRQGICNVHTCQNGQAGWTQGQIPATAAGQPIPNDCWRGSSQVLIENLASGNTFVPPILRVSHLSCSISIPPIALNAIAHIISFRFFMVYIPEGYNTFYSWPAVANSPTTYNVLGTLADHPEWILAEKTMSPLTNGGTTVSLGTRLKRNLNSGDKICLMIVANYSQGLGLLNVNELTMILNWRYAARTN